MSVCSVEFLLALCAVSALIFRLPGVRSRQLLLMLCGVGFFASQGPSLVSCAVLAAFLLSGYGCAILLRARPNRAIFAGYMVLLVASFAFLKKYEFLKAIIPPSILDHPLGVIGLSYMLFRQIHFIVDSMQDQIERPSLWTYLNYQLNPFTLLAGPIARYQEFAESWDGLVPIHSELQGVLGAYWRVFWGMVKVALISTLFLSVHDRFVDQFLPGSGGAGSTPARWGKFALILYSYMMYMYFNFSGYCDIVIAAGGLVGIKLPENFNYPFLSRNLLEYWSRWHITLGHWIRDYLFTPLYKAGVERFPKRGSTVAVAGYFVAFSLAGIWHGSTWNFLVYGLLHGAGVSAAKAWENVILKKSGRPGLREYLKNPVIRWVAIVSTFNYACLTLFFFAFDFDKGRQILATLLGTSASNY
jgi:alginate O-acetyltransferase complex protein AlgI